MVLKLLILGWLITLGLTLIWLVKYFIWKRKHGIGKPKDQKNNHRKILND